MAPQKHWTTTILKTNVKEIVLQKNKNIMNVYNHNLFIMQLGHSPVNSNMILPVDGRANESNSHFTNSFGSIVGGTTGCGGAGGSAAALAGNGNPGYNIVKTGGGSSKRRSHKRSLSKRNKYDRTHWWMLKGGKRSSGKRSGGKRSSGKRSGGKRSSGKRSKRGGLSAMSPASFSGGTGAHYHQFTGGQPLSFNYGIGSRTPLPHAQIGLANNNMMDIKNNCGSDHGLLGLIQGK
jgi:hypothetical protein